jgi:hypothetical protein
MSKFSYYITEEGLLYIYLQDNSLFDVVKNCQNMTSQAVSNLVNKMIKNKIGE